MARQIANPQPPIDQSRLLQDLPELPQDPTLSFNPTKSLLREDGTLNLASISDLRGDVQEAPGGEEAATAIAPKKDETLALMPGDGGRGDSSQAGIPGPREGVSEADTQLRPNAAGMTRWTVSVDPFSADAEKTSITSASGVRGTYHLKRVVGRGGFGEVWESIQMSLGRTVAVKRLREALYQTHKNDKKATRFLERTFRQEAFTTSHLDHPNIVPVHDLGVDDMGRPLLAMKLVRGRPWNDVIDEDFPKLTVDEFLSKHIPIFLDVAQAVAFAHSRGIIHRDLKPSQVMLGDYGEVLLMDWGLALLYDASALLKHEVGVKVERVATLATATNPAGTLAYMAPEQTDRDTKNLGPWTDIFLLGATLYQLLTGSPPHPAPGQAAAFVQAREAYVPPVAEVAPKGREVPEELLAIAIDAMKARREERIPDAKQLVERVQKYLAGASKRRESIMIVREVEDRLARQVGDYREYSDCLALLSRAGTLWTANPSIRDIRERCLYDFAVAALTHGDLTLAKKQASSIEDRGQRDSIMREIKMHEEAVLRNQSRRRMLLRLLIVLLLVLIGVFTFALYYLRQLSEDNERLQGQSEEQRQRAELATREVLASRREGNLSYTEAQFNAAMQQWRQATTAQVDALRELVRAEGGAAATSPGVRLLADGIMAQLGQPAPADEPRELARQRAQAMSSAAEVLMIAGRPGDGERLAMAAVDVVAQATGVSSAETGSAYADLARLREARGDAAGATDAAEKAVAVFDALERARVPGLRWRIEASGVHLRRARAALVSGTLDIAETEAVRSRQRLDWAEPSGEDGRRLLQALASTDNMLGRVLAAQGRADAAKEAWESAEGRLRPVIGELRSPELVAVYVEALLHLDRVDEARTFLPVFREYKITDPDLLDLATRKGLLGVATEPAPTQQDTPAENDPTATPGADGS